MNCQYIGLIAGRYDDEGLYKYYLEQNPSVKTENVKGFHALSAFELIIDFKDGSRELYNMYENYVRPLPEIDTPLSDEQHRKEFPKRLQYWMRVRCINQEQLSSMIDVSQPMICKYLAGRAIPGYVRLRHIADALKITVEDLYLNI